MARRLTACARLSAAGGTDAELIAFELNVEASRRGILPRGLPELHFTHGRFALWSIDDLRRALRIDTAPSPPPHTDGVRDESALAALAAAVNRAFVGGRDAGVLAPWVTTVVCGTSVRVEGPSSAQCGALDGPCARGRYVSTGDCCSVELAATGALCADGVCSASGACVDPSEVPESARVRGPLSWLELMTDGLPHAWHDAAGQVPVSVLPVALPGDGSGGDGDPPSPETWESGFGGALGAPAFRMDAAVAAASGRLAFGRTGEAAPLASAGVDALGARALYVEGAPTRVCVVSGRRIDDLGPVMNDCSTGGPDECLERRVLPRGRAVIRMSFPNATSSDVDHAICMRRGARGMRRVLAASRSQRALLQRSVTGPCPTDWTSEARVRTSTSAAMSSSRPLIEPWQPPHIALKRPRGNDWRERSPG